MIGKRFGLAKFTSNFGFVIQHHGLWKGQYDLGLKNDQKGLALEWTSSEEI